VLISYCVKNVPCLEHTVLEYILFRTYRFKSICVKKRPCKNLRVKNIRCYENAFEMYAVLREDSVKYIVLIAYFANNIPY